AWPSPEGPCDDRVADGDGRDAGNGGANDVEGCGAPLTAEREVHRLERKGRYGRVAAKDADDQELTQRLGREDAAYLARGPSERPDSKCARRVHGQGAPGEGLAKAAPNQAGQEEAADAADKAADQH